MKPRHWQALITDLILLPVLGYVAVRGWDNSRGFLPFHGTAEHAIVILYVVIVLTLLYFPTSTIWKDR